MSTDIAREDLLKLINLVRPALSTLDYIPALKHVRFAGGEVTAYNDISAIAVRLPSDDLDLDLCVPGDLLIRTLGSFNAKSVMLQTDSKGAALLVTSGRSKIKMPVLPSKDFPLSVPEGSSKTPVIDLDEHILKGISQCLISVGNDPTHPATMGVTLDCEDGRAVLYSTDNATISRAATKSKIKLPADAPVILPTFFCEQLISLLKAFPKTEIELELHPGALVAYFWGEAGYETKLATLFSKTLVDTQPLDFPKIIAKHCNVESEAQKDWQPIPDAFDAAFSRALLVLQSEQDKVTKIGVRSDQLDLHSHSSLGDSMDTLKIKATDDPQLSEFYVDPGLVARACKSCTHMGLFKRVMVLGDEKRNFLHLLSHCTAG